MTKPSVCVFCGARDGGNPAYAAAAEAVGAALAAYGWRLVYGAGDVGLMGRVARSAQMCDGETLGVIPTHLVNLEVGKRDLTQFIVTENMHERKKVMFMNSDAIVVLPGGAGSLDEFFEVLTWRQLDLHQKPIFLLDVEGYWQPLKGLIDHIVDHGFAGPTLKEHFRIVQDVPALTEALRAAFS